MKELSQCTILAVDDTRTNLDLLVSALDDHYDLSVAMNGGTALQLVAENPPDLILLDLMMPGMDGFEVLKRLKEQSRTQDIPVILLTAMTDIQSKAKGLTMGAVDYITKPFQIEEMLARINTHLKLHCAQSALKQFNNRLQDLVEQQLEEINQSQLAMIFALAKLSHTRDDNTGLHLERVQHLCRLFSLALSEKAVYSQDITPQFIKAIFHASPLHDVGKVGIEDAILLKPDKLDEQEFAVMKNHTIIGASTLELVHKQYPNNAFIKMGIEIAKYHHEKWDGTGYPEGLANTSIPLSARIMALVDVYEALRSRRPYKEAFTHERAKAIIMEGSGKSFDPKIISVFLQIHQEFDAIYSQMSDNPGCA
jgi:putative two-component system response regulator